MSGRNIHKLVNIKPNQTPVLQQQQQQGSSATQYGGDSIKEMKSKPNNEQFIQGRILRCLWQEQLKQNLYFILLDLKNYYSVL